MTDLITMVIARLATLTAGEFFDNPVSPPATMALSLESGFLPPKRSGSSEADDINFVVARIMRGKESQKHGGIVVRLIGGIHTNGDKNNGQEDIERLLGLLLGMLDQRTYTPYSLDAEADWYFGDPEEGVQPHPKYYVTVDLTFKRAPTATNRR